MRVRTQGLEDTWPGDLGGHYCMHPGRKVVAWAAEWDRNMGLGWVWWGQGWQGVEDTEHLGQKVLSGLHSKSFLVTPPPPCPEHWREWTVSLAAMDHEGRGAQTGTPINLRTPW